jgi:hypothetical protein
MICRGLLLPMNRSKQKIILLKLISFESKIKSSVNEKTKENKKSQRNFFLMLFYAVFQVNKKKTGSRYRTQFSNDNKKKHIFQNGSSVFCCCKCLKGTISDFLVNFSINCELNEKKALNAGDMI